MAYLCLGWWETSGVLWADVVSEGLWLFVTVVIVVSVVLSSDVVHLVDGSALDAALVWAVLGDGEPFGLVRINRETSASEVLFLAHRLNDNWVLHGSETGSIQWLHVENVDSLHLTQDFETLQTGGLLEIGWYGTWGGTRADKILLGLDLIERLDLLLDALLSNSRASNASSQRGRGSSSQSAKSESGSLSKHCRANKKLVIKKKIQGTDGMPKVKRGEVKRVWDYSACGVNK